MPPSFPATWLPSSPISRNNPGQHHQEGKWPQDVTLMQHDLIDSSSFGHPCRPGRSRHLFEDIDTAPALELLESKTFRRGVVLLTYRPG
jgi:hypothetical protein